jgi:polyferredoxin
MKFIIDLIPAKHSMSKDLYQSKKIVPGLGMNCKKIDTCGKNCLLFWKEHKDGIECMHCGRSRYMKVVNEDGAYVQ